MVTAHNGDNRNGLVPLGVDWFRSLCFSMVNLTQLYKTSKKINIVLSKYCHTRNMTKTL